MTSQYAVTQDALTRFSKSAQDRANRLRQIRGALGRCAPQAHAFGKIPESEETRQDCSERADATLENLDFAAAQQEQIAEFIERTARSYQEVEDHTAGQVRAISARAQGVT